jgi:hypothetical protein
MTAANVPRRVPLEPDTDLRKIVEDVHADRIPRLIERDGEALAVISPPEPLERGRDLLKSRRNRDAIMALAGAWSDIDSDKMIEDIYRWRHESPPSPPVEFDVPD